MTLGVEWGGQEAYRSAGMREWRVGGEVAGKVRSGGGMSFVTVLDAGHLVRATAPLVEAVLTDACGTDALRPACQSAGGGEEVAGGARD